MNNKNNFLDPKAEYLASKHKKEIDSITQKLVGKTYQESLLILQHVQFVLKNNLILRDS